MKLQQADQAGLSVAARMLKNYNIFVFTPATYVGGIVSCLASGPRPALAEDVLLSIATP